MINARIVPFSINEVCEVFTFYEFVNSNKLDNCKTFMLAQAYFYSFGGGPQTTTFKTLTFDLIQITNV
ncbi:hypothetical protein TTHERM_000653659 (macronuclear) [Tetrahymena thermophila SB210]|uniref:Uncharacterized protein n=1 Tax=Tetrahymena thermophila (strain SB210) TaxID=312017 RepID=W7XBW8_TETTS|nr:hypothetical protein TTHERM_000653659 [Tetrahymena thermophila SB210]EWS74822.1 hypothetical protein TTHERM_000653659 [Tetrahymena thermophila SB210]|eukprot:XP_012652653.1 hypothetical protein TTHERM_000653659 [Tetrahymena thermophila SB210]